MEANILFDLMKLDKILYFILGIFLIVLISKILEHWSKNLQERFIRQKLTILQISTAFIFIFYLVGTVALFYVIFRPTKEVLVAMGGSAAVAIGLALKDLVESIIAGFILLLDRPFQVGDRVTFSDNYGEIVSIGPRSVRLQTLDDNLVTIPNSKFLSDVVSSGNSGALDMMIVINFYISIEEDLEKVKNLLHETVITSKFVFLERPVVVVFEEIPISNTFVIKVSAKCYVLDCKYEKALQSDIVLRANKIFREEGILRPSSVSQ